jgi:hypothetical protein
VVSEGADEVGRFVVRAGHESIQAEVGGKV